MKEKKNRPGFVRAMVVSYPGAKQNGQPMTPPKSKTVQISQRRAKDKNYLAKNGLVLIQEPVMPPMPVDPIATPAEKVAPMTPKKVNVKSV